MLNLILSLNPIALGIIGIIIVLLLMDVFASAKVRSAYKELTRDISNTDNQETGVFQNVVNNAIKEEFNRSNEKNIKEVNTIAIIEKNVFSELKGVLLWERFIKRSSSLMIVLGLVGTFFGLTLSIAELVDLLSNSGEAIANSGQSITTGLLSSIRGMSVAFITSLFGISASILVTIMNILFGAQESREMYVTSCEAYLDNVIGAQSVDFTDVDEEGRTPLERSFDELGGKLEENLKEVTKVLSYRMTVATNEMASTAEAIKGSLELFGDSVENFSENTRDFAEFNHHLRTNIERMSVTFADFTEEIKDVNKEQTR